MWLVATVTHEEARALLDELLPLTLHLDDDPNTQRFVCFERATSVEMLEGRGLRVSCPGRVVWSTRVGTLEMRIKEAVATLVPSIEQEGEHASLRFRAEIEALDFEWVPDLVDAGIAQVIQRKLGEKPAAWRFTDLFTRTIPMPASVAPARVIDLRTREPSATVSERAMSFVLFVATTTKPHAPVS